ncbi:hypothetical protein Phum_PHUM354640 [Pediculus humanus corporis]|uniref:Uncharacterized protein n=1 Tax=Pediculus humanus subsp. corporis TaxID=121224 RepID=E0VP90_PEDHC|nr:uncharacterized protein Phum_PHUM354640 [Pediculus humanus corporis]EEB15196.1 hypothetical protein Phum_PHUM354640 [Pediculus humanus corporis]
MMIKLTFVLSIGVLIISVVDVVKLKSSKLDGTEGGIKILEKCSKTEEINLNVVEDMCLPEEQPPHPHDHQQRQRQEETSEFKIKKNFQSEHGRYEYIWKGLISLRIL